MGIQYLEAKELYVFVDYCGRITDQDTDQAALISRHAIDLDDTLGWEEIPEEPELTNHLTQTYA